VGRARKLWNALTAWLKAMDYSAFDCANERILGFERDVERLKSELKRARCLAAWNLCASPPNPSDRSRKRITR
jgi:hypothetical protein